MHNYEQALCFATQKHEGQTRQGGAPYITHPVAVAEMLKEQGYGVEYQITGLFHDLLEDTDATEQEIADIGGERVLSAVKLLTKAKGYDMAEYIRRIRADEIAFAVKTADRLHNLRCTIYASENFRRKYIEESRKWYMDFSEEIAKAVEALEKTLQGNNTERKSLFYCLTLDDYSCPSFCTFEKYYFGSIPQIASLIGSLEADENTNDSLTRLIQAFKEYCNGNTEVTYEVAYKEIPLLQPVFLYGLIKITTDSNKVEHLNAWDLPYYLRWVKAESEHIWLGHGKLYVRCIKTCFTNLQYSDVDTDAEYEPIETGIGFGFPNMIDIKDDLTTNKLFVIEKFFDNEEELLKDIRKFTNTPDPIYTEIFNDIFGDG